MASPTTADTTSEAPGPQATHQPGTEAHAGRAEADSKQPSTGNGGQDIAKVAPRERIGEPTSNAGQPKRTDVGQRVQPDTVADRAPEEPRTDRPIQPQEAANFLASILDELATAAGQGQPANGGPVTRSPSPP